MRGRGRPNRQSRRGDRQSSDSSTNLNTPTSAFRSPRPQRQRTEYTAVPSHSSITAGTGVSIILKQDQPTGHQVQGIVADLLTRGDHPRGVKVRLRDGRVGRVQRLVGEAEGTRGENLAGGAGANLGRDGDATATSAGGRGAKFHHTRDIREDDEYLYDETRVQGRATGGLFAALEAADARHQQSRSRNVVAEESPGAEDEIAACPVCGEFKGDERGVAHHVEGHFADN